MIIKKISSLLVLLFFFFPPQNHESKSRRKKNEVKKNRKTKINRRKKKSIGIVPPFLIGVTFIAGFSMIVYGTEGLAKKKARVSSSLFIPKNDNSSSRPLLPLTRNKPKKTNKKKINKAITKTAKLFFNEYNQTFYWVKNEPFTQLNSLLLFEEAYLLLSKEDFLNQERYAKNFAHDLEREKKVLVLSAPAQLLVALCFVAKDLLGWTKEQLFNNLAPNSFSLFSSDALNIKDNKAAWQTYMAIWLKVIANTSSEIKQKEWETEDTEDPKFLLTWEELFLTPLGLEIEAKKKELEAIKKEYEESKDPQTYIMSRMAGSLLNGSSQLDLVAEASKLEEERNIKQKELPKKIDRMTKELNKLSVKKNRYSYYHRHFFDSLKNQATNYSEVDQLVDYIEAFVEKYITFYEGNQKGCEICHQYLSYHPEKKNIVCIEKKTGKVTHKDCLESRQVINPSLYTTRKISPSKRNKKELWTCYHCQNNNLKKKKNCEKCKQSRLDSNKAQTTSLRKKFQEIPFREISNEEISLDSVTMLDGTQKLMLEKNLKKIQEKKNQAAKINQNILIEDLFIPVELKKLLWEVFLKTDTSLHQLIGLLKDNIIMISKSRQERTQIPLLLNEFEKNPTDENKDKLMEGLILGRQNDLAPLVKIFTKNIQKLEKESEGLKENFEAAKEKIKEINSFSEINNLLNHFEMLLKQGKQFSNQDIIEMKDIIRFCQENDKTYWDKEQLNFGFKRTSFLRFFLFAQVYHKKNKLEEDEGYEKW